MAPDAARLGRLARARAPAHEWEHGGADPGQSALGCRRGVPDRGHLALVARHAPEPRPRRGGHGETRAPKADLRVVLLRATAPSGSGCLPEAPTCRQHIGGDAPDRGARTPGPGLAAFSECASGSRMSGDAHVGLRERPGAPRADSTLRCLDRRPRKCPAALIETTRASGLDGFACLHHGFNGLHAADFLAEVCADTERVKPGRAHRHERRVEVRRFAARPGALLRNRITVLRVIAHIYTPILKNWDERAA